MIIKSSWEDDRNLENVILLTLHDRYIFFWKMIWKYRLPCRGQALLSAVPEATGWAHSSRRTPDYGQDICRTSCLAFSRRQHPPWWTGFLSRLNDIACPKPRRCCGLPGFLPPFIFLLMSSASYSLEEEGGCSQGLSSPSFPWRAPFAPFRFTTRWKPWPPVPPSGSWPFQFPPQLLWWAVHLHRVTHLSDNSLGSGISVCHWFVHERYKIV